MSTNTLSTNTFGNCRETDRFEIQNHLCRNYRHDIYRDVYDGMGAPQKFVPSKYFYDARGSMLFARICTLPEYYVTRTEVSLLREVSPSIMDSFESGDLVELGSGGNKKIRIFLDAAGRVKRSQMRYVAMDISESALLEASGELLGIYPELRVCGIVADFTSQVDVVAAEHPLMLLFLGSTIGNFDDDSACALMRCVSESMKEDDRLFVGFDMVKDTATLERAYNDADGVTAEFNKNVLNVLNRELGADFPPSCFTHVAFYNDALDRIEMHLRATCDLDVFIEALQLEVSFKEGETIHTENSRKFTPASIERMAEKAGLRVNEWHTSKTFADATDAGKRGDNSNGWFSLVGFAKAR